MGLFDIQKDIANSSCLNDKINIAIISNISFEPYFNALLKSKFINNNTFIDILPIDFEDYQSQENIEKIIKVNYVVVCLNFGCLYPNSSIDIITNKISIDEFFNELKNLCRNIYQFIKTQANVHILWFGFEDYCYCYNIVTNTSLWNNNLIDRINNEIYSLVKDEDTYIDLKCIIARIGAQKAYDHKNKYRWNAPYSKMLIDELCNEIYKNHLINTGITKKCIVLDCDNVLWGGILSEDGIQNISLNNSGQGMSYQDFQRFLLYLYYHGVILTICSKNDLVDVIKIFNEHSEMILKEEHISLFQVNWDNKPENIKKISETLNISLDNMVFIDDSDFEIQFVKSVLPSVTSFKYERDSIYNYLNCFNLKNNIDIEKVQKRNNTYKTNEKRYNLKLISSTFDEYISSLEMKIDIHESLPVEINRISELTQRTNKCTNGRRYTVDELKELIKNNNYTLYSVSLSDKFSDLGLIGVIGIENNATLDLFSLSCRALGRNIENEMLALINTYAIKSYYFTLTSKNNNIKILLENLILNKNK